VQQAWFLARTRYDKTVRRAWRRLARIFEVRRLPRARLVADGEPAGSAPHLFLEPLESFPDYVRFLAREASTLARQQEVERRLLERFRGKFIVEGRCYVCESESGFLVDDIHAYGGGPDGRSVPNWRERLVCLRCGLNNRRRATVHLVESIGDLSAGSAIYLTERKTPTYARFAARFPACIGSELLDDGTMPGATNRKGIRHEDITALTFADASFDAVISLDVLEHVPDFEAGFAECHRVLKPGGKLFVTVPFRIDRESNLVRARLRDDGSIEHLLEPEYHGDPIAQTGCLAYYHFGWQILDQMRAAGFDRAAAYLYWSREWGYLGGSQILLVANGCSQGP
jgi:SAM-dependent methyltransferase